MRPSECEAKGNLSFRLRHQKLLFSLNTLCMLVETTLVQDQLCCTATTVRNKSDLGVNDREKIIAITLGENLGLGLPCCLREEMIVFAGNRQNEVRRQLITSDITVEDLWRNDDLFVLFRWRCISGDSVSMNIPSVLVQDYLFRRPFTIGDESNLSIDNFQEIVPIALRKDLEFRLARGLLEETVALFRNRNVEIRSQLIASDVAVEQLRIDSDLLMLLRGRIQRNARIEQVAPDVINALRRFGV